MATVTLTANGNNLFPLGVGPLPDFTYNASIPVTYGPLSPTTTGTLNVFPAVGGAPVASFTTFTVTKSASGVFTLFAEANVVSVAGVSTGNYIKLTYTGQTPSVFSTSEFGTFVTDPLTGTLLTPLGSAANDPVTSNPCFAEGTLIRTPRGDVAVEHLTVGQLVVTASGEHRPIKWLGHRVTHPSRHPRPHEVMPICIAPHAFGDGKPFKSLIVSPGHSIGIDVVGEVLIPAGLLVNGSTVQQLEVDEITYWHVELDSHDVILANGMSAESYLEMSNRAFFGDAGVIDLNAGPDPVVVTHADFCRPFVDHGPLLDAVRVQLRRRAETLGWTLAQADLADLHLDVDGTRVSPMVRGLVARFEVPADASKLTLVSRTARPCDVGQTDDMRNLGVCLKGLTIDDGFGETERLAIDDPRLTSGLCDVEGGASRWTTGRTPLPAELSKARPGGFFLRVELARPALSQWVGPEASTAVEAPRQPVRLAIVA